MQQYLAILKRATSLGTLQQQIDALTAAAAAAGGLVVEAEPMPFTGRDSRHYVTSQAVVNMPNDAAAKVLDRYCEGVVKLRG